MPLYAYECDKCGAHFERRQSFDDAPIRTCPECRGKVHRLIQPAGVIFKGSGFYSTDHKGSSSMTASAKDKAESNGGAKDKPAGDSASKSETKTASKKESATTTNA